MPDTIHEPAHTMASHFGAEPLQAFVESRQWNVRVRLLGLCTESPQAMVGQRQMGQAGQMQVPFNPLRDRALSRNGRENRPEVSSRSHDRRCWRVRLRECGCRQRRKGQCDQLALHVSLHVRMSGRIVVTHSAATPPE